MRNKSPSRLSREAVGWREWVSLPDWDVPWVKAKVDTGARTSALHAFETETFARDERPWVRFAVHPWQGSAKDEVVAEAPLLAHRHVRSSSGASDERPVIMATVIIAGHLRSIEVTLTRRDEMGFRMLIGRQALRGTFVVDPARSYLGGRPTREIRRRNRGKA